MSCRPLATDRSKTALLASTLASLALLALAAPANARTLYMTNYASGSVSALSIGADGGLSPIAGSPFATVGSTNGMSISPDGGTLIALQRQTPGDMGAFTPAPGGSLTPRPGALNSLPGSPTYSTMHPSGRFAYVANNSGLLANRLVSAFALVDGAMPGSLGTFPGGGINQMGIASSVDGRFVYMANNASSTNVRGYSVDAGGTLTPLPGSPFNVGANSASGLATSPDGRFLFVADPIDDQIASVAIGSDGALTPIGSPVSVGPGSEIPEGLVVTPDGRNLYVVNEDPTNRSISAFRIASDGTLTLNGTPLAQSATPRALAITPDGSRLYVALSAAGSNLLGFSIGGDGTLTALPGSPYSSGGDNSSLGAQQAIAIAPNQGPKAVVTAEAKGSKVSFSAAGSSDPDGSVARYAWSFGDGQTAETTAPTVEHVYKDGKHEATLRVIDDEGCSATLVYTGQTALCNGGPGASASTTVTIDATPPKVSALKVPKRLVKGKGKRLAITFRISEAATATVAIERSQPGRRVKGKCVKAKRSNRTAKPCKHWARATVRKLSAKAGANSLKLSAKATKRLKAGSYRVAIAARDAAGNATAKPVRKSFRVVKPKPKKKR